VNSFLRMKTFGLEYTILPLISIVYFRVVEHYTWPGALGNNVIVTLVCAAGAHWRSKQLAKHYATRTRKPNANCLEPMWPALVFLLLLFMAALQLILCISHVSYYRKGPLLPDLFDA
jgi:hypothetical protein